MNVHDIDNSSNSTMVLKSEEKDALCTTIRIIISIRSKIILCFSIKLFTFWIHLHISVEISMLSSALLNSCVYIPVHCIWRRLVQWLNVRTQTLHVRLSTPPFFFFCCGKKFWGGFVFMLMGKMVNYHPLCSPLFLFEGQGSLQTFTWVIFQLSGRDSERGILISSGNTFFVCVVVQWKSLSTKQGNGPCYFRIRVAT